MIYEEIGVHKNTMRIIGDSLAEWKVFLVVSTGMFSIHLDSKWTKQAIVLLASKSDIGRGVNFFFEFDNLNMQILLEDIP